MFWRDEVNTKLAVNGPCLWTPCWRLRSEATIKMHSSVRNIAANQRDPAPLHTLSGWSLVLKRFVHFDGGKTGLEDLVQYSKISVKWRTSSFQHLTLQISWSMELSKCRVLFRNGVVPVRASSAQTLSGHTSELHSTVHFDSAKTASHRIWEYRKVACCILELRDSVVCQLSKCTIIFWSKELPLRLVTLRGSLWTQLGVWRLLCILIAQESLCFPDGSDRFKPWMSLSHIDISLDWPGPEELHNVVQIWVAPTERHHSTGFLWTLSHLVKHCALL